MPTKKLVKVHKPAAKAKAAAKPKLPLFRADEVEMSGIHERVMVSESDPDQEIREIFSHYDRDKDGEIELPEFARICEAIGLSMEEDELATGYAIVDGDSDGKINWREFVAWWRSLGR